MPNEVSTNTVTSAALRTVVRTENSREEAQVAPQSGKNLPPETKAVEPREVDVEQLAERLNEFARSIKRELQFSVDDSSGRTVIKVLDPQTDEVIRQIPSEEILRLAARISDAQSLLFDGIA
ncbi:MAG: flagellar protein FlaG [Pseudomonadota bacterium]